MFPKNFQDSLAWNEQIRYPNGQPTQPVGPEGTAKVSPAWWRPCGSAFRDSNDYRLGIQGTHCALVSRRDTETDTSSALCRRRVDRTEQNTRDEHRPSEEVRNIKACGVTPRTTSANSWMSDGQRGAAHRSVSPRHAYYTRSSRTSRLSIDRRASHTIQSTEPQIIRSPVITPIRHDPGRWLPPSALRVAGATFQISPPLHMTSTRHVVSRASCNWRTLSSAAIHRSKASCRFYLANGTIRVIEERLPFGRERSSTRDRIHARPTLCLSPLIIQGEWWLVEWHMQLPVKSRTTFPLDIYENRPKDQTVYYTRKARRDPATNTFEGWRNRKGNAPEHRVRSIRRSARDWRPGRFQTGRSVTSVFAPARPPTANQRPAAASEIFVCPPEACKLRLRWSWPRESWPPNVTTIPVLHCVLCTVRGMGSMCHRVSSASVRDIFIGFIDAVEHLLLKVIHWYGCSIKGFFNNRALNFLMFVTLFVIRFSMRSRVVKIMVVSR